MASLGHVIVDQALYRHGARVPVRTEGLEALRAAAGHRDSFCWVGLADPTPEELEDVAGVFGLHGLAVEDAVRAHQRPKLERYDDALFLVLKTLWYVDADDQVETGEIAVFIGRDFVITVRHGQGNELAEARRELEERSQVLSHGPSAVVYAVVDRVVDAYEEVASSLVEDVDEVEASVFSDERSDDGRRIYLLKRELSEMRRAVVPLREPVHRFSMGTVRGMDPDAGPYFRDVADHLTRVAETIESLDTLLSTAFDAHLARISIQQNDDMRRISALVGMVATPTLIAGVYGMNFTNMPELHWVWGYPMAVLLMLISAGVVFWISRRAGWL
ncbi:magnesium/cobalt transporter CorA [Alteromonas gracilis]